MRWKGFFEGGGTQIIYLILAASCLITAPIAGSIEAAAGILLMAGVFAWFGLFDS